MPQILAPGATLPTGTPSPAGGKTNYLSLYNFGTPWGGRPPGAGPSNAPIASPGNIQGSNPQGGAGPYGGIPQVPSPITSQQNAIGGNIGNLGNLYNLGTGLNTQIANEAALPYNLNLPQYQSMLGQSSGNILDLLKGQVPQDVANQISQMAAERGVSTGSIGSPNANTALLRSLGLTSLGLQQQGEGELTGAIGRTPTGQQFNPASFLVSPGDVESSQYLSNLLSAAPDPTQSAQASIQNALAGLGYGQRSFGQQPGFGLPQYSQPTAGSPYAGGQSPLGGINPSADTQGFAQQYGSPIGPLESMTQEDANYLLYGDQTGGPLTPDDANYLFYGGGDYFGS